MAEKTLLNLTELLMNQLLKLDGITVIGDVNLQRKLQVILFLILGRKLYIYIYFKVLIS